MVTWHACSAVSHIHTLFFSFFTEVFLQSIFFFSTLISHLNSVVLQCCRHSEYDTDLLVKILWIICKLCNFSYSFKGEGKWNSDRTHNFGSNIRCSWTRYVLVMITNRQFYKIFSLYLSQRCVCKQFLYRDIKSANLSSSFLKSHVVWHFNRESSFYLRFQFLWQVVVLLFPLPQHFLLKQIQITHWVMFLIQRCTQPDFDSQVVEHCKYSPSWTVSNLFAERTCNCDIEVLLSFLQI